MQCAPNGWHGTNYVTHNWHNLEDNSSYVGMLMTITGMIYYAINYSCVKLIDTCARSMSGEQSKLHITLYNMYNNVPTPC